MAFTPIIIGIAGQKQSGKDTVASMCNYIINYGIGKAEYYDWLARRKIYDEQFKGNIIHFADALKDVCSILFNIDRDKFDDVEYKDNKYYDLQNKIFVDKINCKYEEILIEDLNYGLRLEFAINTLIEEEVIPCIKLRTILQHIGTNIIRNNIGKDTWINITKKRIIDVVSKAKCCLIPDVRFKNEAESIEKISAYKAATIKILRSSCEQTNHESESINFNCDYTIRNDNSLISLFYTVKGIIKQILENG